MLEQIFLGFTGLCSGFIIAGGLTGLMIGLSIIPRYAGIYPHSRSYIAVRRHHILGKQNLETLFFLFSLNIRFGTPFLILYGLFQGIFTLVDGSWPWQRWRIFSLSLPEEADSERSFFLQSCA